MNENDVFTNFDEIIKILLERKWHLKLGKRREAEQSLLAHSLNAMSVAFVISEILDLDEIQARNLILAGLIHDCAEKESEEWQKYALGLRERPSEDFERVHDLLTKIKPYLKNPLSDSDENDIIQAVKLHMKWSQSDDAMAMALHGGVSEEFIKLLDLLRLIDGIVSNTSISKLVERVKTDKFYADVPFPPQYKLEFHIINKIRGISTILLHYAIEKAYEKKGFKPILYYDEGTVYIGPKSAEIPTIDEITKELNSVIISWIDERKDRFAKIVIGSPTATFFNPIPYYDIKDMGKLTLEAVIKKYLPGISRNIDPKTGDVKDSIKKKDNAKLNKYLEVVKKENLSFDKNNEELMFAFYVRQLDEYLVMMLKNLVATSSGYIKNNADAVYQFLNDIFGENFMSYVESTSTAGLYQNILPLVLIWNKKISDLPQDILDKFSDKIQNKTYMYELDYEIRANILVELFSEAIDKGEYDLGFDIDSIFEEMINADLTYPLFEFPDFDNTTFAKSKLTARKSNIKDNEIVICPICNTKTAHPVKAIAGVVGPGPDKFTNRAVALQSGKIQICQACDFEGKLRQLGITNSMDVMYYLLPTMNTTRSMNKAVLRMIREYIDKSIVLPSIFTRTLQEYILDIDNMDLSKFISDIAKINLRKEIDKKSEFMKALKKIIDEDGLRQYGYASYEDFFNAYLNDKDSVIQKIRSNQNLFIFITGRSAQIITNTPNIALLIPQRQVTSDKRSEIDNVLSSLYFAMFIAYVSLSKVVIVNGEGLETIPPVESYGIVKVPDHPYISNILKRFTKYSIGNWISLADLPRLLKVFSSYFYLANFSSSDRNSIFEVFTARTPEYILVKNDRSSDEKKADASMMIRAIDTIKENEVI